MLHYDNKRNYNAAEVTHFINYCDWYIAKFIADNCDLMKKSRVCINDFFEQKYYNKAQERNEIVQEGMPLIFCKSI